MFKSFCDKHINRLGLKEWSVHYDHSKVDDVYAQTYWRLSAGVATIILSTYWDDLRPKTDKEVDRLALHEVLHLLMAPIVAEANERYTNQSSIDTAEHLIIRRLENLFD